ncbi:MAG: hypothetical protein D6778_04280, partial [Nitrospirae bacterium]
MKIKDILRKKRDGQELTEEEIGFLIKEYLAERVPDY